MTGRVYVNFLEGIDAHPETLGDVYISDIWHLLNSNTQ